MHDMIPSPMIILIIVGYLVIAFQFYREAKKSEGNKGKKAMFLLLGIFVLCTFAGYLPQLITMPFVVELAIHTALILATWWFIFTNQAALIMKALK